MRLAESKCLIIPKLSRKKIVPEQKFGIFTLKKTLSFLFETNLYSLKASFLVRVKVGKVFEICKFFQLFILQIVEEGRLLKVFFSIYTANSLNTWHGSPSIHKIFTNISCKSNYRQVFSEF